MSGAATAAPPGPSETPPTRPDAARVAYTAAADASHRRRGHAPAPPKQNHGTPTPPRSHTRAPRRKRVHDDRSRQTTCTPTASEQPHPRTHIGVSVPSSPLAWDSNACKGVDEARSGGNGRRKPANSARAHTHRRAPQFRCARWRPRREPAHEQPRASAPPRARQRDCRRPQRLRAYTHT